MREIKNPVLKMDLGLLIALFLLMSIGLLTVYSATYNDALDTSFWGSKYGKQTLWLFASLFIGFFVLLFDAEYFRGYSAYFYFFTLFLLVLVLFMPPVNGARAWLGVAGLGIQPAEFAKISTALFLAKWVEQQNIKLQEIRGVFQFMGIILVPSFLIFLQPDAGTLIVFSSFFFVLYREGVSFDPLIIPLIRRFIKTPLKSTWLGEHFIPFFFFITLLGFLTLYLSSSSFVFVGIPLSGYGLLYFIISLLFVLISGGIWLFGYRRTRIKSFTILISSTLFCFFFIGFITLFFEKVAAPHQKKRIELLLGLDEDPNGSDYNRNRAMTAVGSGGGFGKGLFEASISGTRTNHVPESETDFIFCSFAEEWGFVGSLIFIVLNSFIILKTFQIAERQRSVFSRVYANCVGFIFFYHFSINLGMNIGLAPVIGIPLPLMSYGGSSLLSFSLMFFILLNLDSHRKDVLR